MRATWLLLLLAGCTANVNQCKDKTLFVTVTLDAGARDADQLLVDVSLDGGAPIHTTLAHQAGSGMGGLQIEFPSGYPKGHSVGVVVTATAAGAIVGSGMATKSLNAACESASITVSSSSAADDLSVRQGDLSLEDLASSSSDAASSDGASDAAPNADLATTPDLAPCVATAENCFNNIDDDCDGKVDCDDTDCTGGGTPKAVCVPNPGTFAPGVVLASGGICPPEWPTSTGIHAGITSPCGAGSCACNTPNFTCGAELWNRANSSDCTGGGVGLIFAPQGVCSGPFQLNNGPYHDQSTFYSGDCGPKTGVADKQMPTWGTTEVFCGQGVAGGGCSGGGICVPAVGPNHCVIHTGSSLQGCPSTYVLRSGSSYYLDFDDSTRQCNCACGLTGGGIPCTGTASVQLFTDSGCSIDGPDYGSCSNADIHLYGYAKATGILFVRGNACTGSGTNQTATTLLGEQTVCCAP